MRFRFLAIFIVALVAVLAVKRHPSVTAAPQLDVAALYTAHCTGATVADDCDVLHAQTVLDTAAALDDLRTTRDPQAVDLALQAMALDEPPVLEAATKILAPLVGKRNDVDQAFVPLLVGAYPKLQQLAADALRRSKNRDIVALVEMWKQNHPRPDSDVSVWLRELHPPRYVPAFPAYPNVQHFAPGNGDHSMAWSTPDSVDKVVAAFAKDTKANLDASEWRQHFATTTITVGPSQMQQLIEDYRKHPDPKLLEQIKQASKSRQAMQGFSGSVPQASVFAVQPPPSAQSFHGLVIEGDADHATRALVVYRLESIHATVIVMTWDLVRYPPR